MAITFLQKKKLQQRLLLAFIGVLLLIVFMLWLGFKKKSAPLSPEKIFTPKKEIKINLEPLKVPLLEQLQPFKKIEEFEGEAGRGNPFVPH